MSDVSPQNPSNHARELTRQINMLSALIVVACTHDASAMRRTIANLAMEMQHNAIDLRHALEAAR